MTTKGYEWFKEYYAKLRLETFLAYSTNPPKCACCGYSDITKKIHNHYYMELDHIQGRNQKEPKQSSHALMSQLKKAHYPPGYKVLCRGCNVSIEPRADKCELHKQTTAS